MNKRTTDRTEGLGGCGFERLFKLSTAFGLHFQLISKSTTGPSLLFQTFLAQNCKYKQKRETDNLVEEEEINVPTITY